MLMVIFGAGASFDSSDTYRPPQPGADDREERPPLANDLFQQRGFFDLAVREYRECAPVITRLRRHFNNTLEGEMERLRLEAQQEEQTAVELHAVRYYLRNILWRCGEAWLQYTTGVTNYVQLLRQIRVWHQRQLAEEVWLVTFNYDTLLEDACLRALRMEIQSVSGYVSRVYKVIKPHGSVNWVRTLGQAPAGADTSAQAEHSIIARGTSVTLDPGIHVVANLNQIVLEGRYVYPAIALPVNTKIDFECPDDHIAQLKAAVPAVTKLLVIGWRGTEPHFLDFWKRPRLNSVPDAISKIQIVAGDRNRATEVQNQLRGSGIQGRFLLSEGGFSQFVTGPELDAFLAD